MKNLDVVTFLCNYYGIYHEALSNKKISHDDIESLFPQIQSFSHCDSSDLLKGNMIGVIDCNHHVKYYVNPHLIIDNPSHITEEEEIKKIPLVNLNQLSKEELLQLRRKLRLNNQRKESYLINKFIRFIKRQEPREYRKKKEKILLKESIYD